MDEIINPDRLVSVPFNKTRCGVDFYINTAINKDIGLVLTENKRFKTDFFSFYFFRKANGYLLLNFRKIELRDRTSWFRADRADDGTCIRLCAKSRGLPDRLYNG